MEYLVEAKQFSVDTMYTAFVCSFISKFETISYWLLMEHGTIIYISQEKSIPNSCHLFPFHKLKLPDAFTP